MSCIVPKPCFKNFSNAKVSLGLKVSIRQFYTLLTASGWNCGVKGLKTGVRIICSRILYVCGYPKMNKSIQVSALHKKYLINENWAFFCYYVSIDISISLWWRKNSWPEEMSWALICSSESWVKLFPFFSLPVHFNDDRPYQALC